MADGTVASTEGERYGMAAASAFGCLLWVCVLQAAAGRARRK